MRKKNILLVVMLIALSFLCFGCSFGFPLPNPNPQNHQHSLTKINEVASTCTQMGVKSHFVCNGCGKMFSDINATNEVTLSDLQTPKQAHTYYNGTCINCGSVNGTVDNTHKHTLVFVGEVKPTCQSDGHKSYYECSECRRMFSDINQTTEVYYETVLLDKVDHVINDGRCIVCGKDNFSTFITKEIWESLWNIGDFRIILSQDNRQMGVMTFIGNKGMLETNNGTTYYEQVGNKYYTYEMVDGLWTKKEIDEQSFISTFNFKENLYMDYSNITFTNYYTHIEGFYSQEYFANICYMIVNNRITHVIMEGDGHSRTYAFDELSSRDSITIPQVHNYEPFDVTVKYNTYDLHECSGFQTNTAANVFASGYNTINVLILLFQFSGSYELNYKLNGGSLYFVLKDSEVILEQTDNGTITLDVNENDILYVNYIPGESGYLVLDFSNFYYEYQTQSIQKTIVEPTCTKSGYAISHCSDCGEVININLPKLPHEFLLGECINCGYRLDSVITKEDWENLWNLGNFKLVGTEYNGTVSCISIDGTVYMWDDRGDYRYYYYDSENQQYWEILPEDGKVRKQPISEFAYKISIDVTGEIRVDYEILRIDENGNLYADLSDVIIEYTIVNNKIKEAIIISKYDDSIIMEFVFEDVTSNDVIVLPNAHYYQEQIVTEATCQNEGLKVCVCADCGDSYEQTIERTYHNYNYYTGICEYCGEKDPFYYDPYENAYYDFEYEIIEKGKIRLTRLIAGATNIIIPDKINEYEVTEIGQCTFSYCYPVKSVRIPSTVTRIYKAAFDNCYYLTTINYDGTIEMWNSINKEENWRINTDITTISCSDGDIIHTHTLEMQPEIQATCTMSGQRQYYECSECKMCFLDESATQIVDWSYIYVPQTEHIVVNDICINCNNGVKDGLVYALTDDGTYIFGEFYSYSNEIVIADDINGIAVTKIVSYSFLWERDITKVVIGKNITEIYEYTFYGCENLSEVVIPVSVTSIDSYSFYECLSLTSLTYEGTVEMWQSNFNNLKLQSTSIKVVHCIDGDVYL